MLITIKFCVQSWFVNQKEKRIAAERQQALSDALYNAELEKIKEALVPVNFSKLVPSTASEHDEIIAFSSQLAHVVSSAYIKSDTATKHHGFSAGSYKDMTRVAWLNASMWAELCMENRDNSLFELDCYIKSLEAYRDALERRDIDTLTALLEEGKKIKEEVDGWRQ